MHSTTSHALPSSALMCGSGHIQSWCSSQIDSLFVCECKVTILLVGIKIQDLSGIILCIYIGFIFMSITVCYAVQ